MRGTIWKDADAQDLGSMVLYRERISTLDSDSTDWPSDGSWNQNRAEPWNLTSSESVVTHLLLPISFCTSGWKVSKGKRYTKETWRQFKEHYCTTRKSPIIHTSHWIARETFVNATALWGFLAQLSPCLSVCCPSGTTPHHEIISS